VTHEKVTLHAAKALFAANALRSRVIEILGEASRNGDTALKVRGLTHKAGLAANDAARELESIAQLLRGGAQ